MGVLHGDIEKVLYNQDVIAEAVSQLGKQLAQDYAEKTPLVLGTLCGAFVFMAGDPAHMHYTIWADHRIIRS